MSLAFPIDLVSGGRAELVLEEPDPFPSSYFISMEHSGAAEFWRIVMKLLAAAKRSVCKLGQSLGKAGLTRQDVTDSAMRNLLQTNGYAFGIFRGVDPALRDLDLTDHKTFIFVRDPRDVVVSMHLAMRDGKGKVPANRPAEKSGNDRDSNTVPILNFVRALEVDNIALQYRRFADFCGSAKNVSVFRYEDVMFSWRTLLVDLIVKLDLQTSRESAFAIADSSAVLANVSRVTGTGRQDLYATFREHLDEAATAILEEKFSYPMAFFGYAPEKSLPTVFLDHQREFLRAVSERLSIGNAQCSDLAARAASSASQSRKVQIANTAEHAQLSTAHARRLKKPRMTTASARPDSCVPRPHGHTEPDPVLMMRLKANALAEMKVLGRRVVMEVDSTGCRAVVGQPQSGEKTLAVYGCSFTFGTAIAAEETFCSLLQSMFPTWRVENHGVPSYCGTQNLIQLERDSRWGAVDYVTFCWHPHHMLRNVADLSWIQMLSKSRKESLGQTAQIGTSDVPQLTCPRASLDQDAKLQVRAVRCPRLDLVGIDLEDFSPDPYYLDLVCFSLFRRAADIVNEHGGHFFVTTLWGHLSQQLQRRLKDFDIPVVDASLDGPEYTCLPDDAHPNALANRIYAEKIRDYLASVRQTYTGV